MFSPFSLHFKLSSAPPQHKLEISNQHFFLYILRYTYCLNFSIMGTFSHLLHRKSLPFFLSRIIPSLFFFSLSALPCVTTAETLFLQPISSNHSRVLPTVLPGDEFRFQVRAPGDFNSPENRNTSWNVHVQLYFDVPYRKYYPRPILAASPVLDTSDMELNATTAPAVESTQRLVNQWDMSMRQFIEPMPPKVTAEIWDDVAFYTWERYANIILYGVSHQRYHSNASSATGNTTASYYNVLIHNYNTSQFANMTLTLRVDFYPASFYPCPTGTKDLQYPCSAQGSCIQPGDNSKSPHNNPRGICSCNIAGIGEEMASAGEYCQAKYKDLKTNIEGTIIRDYDPNTLHYFLYRVPRTGSIGISLRLKEYNTQLYPVLIAKKDEGNGGEYLSKGTQLPTAYDYRFTDYFKVTVKDRFQAMSDLFDQGDLIWIAIYNWVQDDAAGLLPDGAPNNNASTVSVSFYPCGSGAREYLCPYSSSVYVIMKTVLIPIMATLCAMIIIMIVFMIFRARYYRRNGLDPWDVHNTHHGLSIKAIEKSFPKFKYDNAKHAFDIADDGEPQCSICLCEYENGQECRKLNCDHVYHAECIDPWMKTHVTCPSCRQSAEPKRRNFLCCVPRPHCFRSSESNDEPNPNGAQSSQEPSIQAGNSSRRGAINETAEPFHDAFRGDPHFGTFGLIEERRDFAQCQEEEPPEEPPEEPTDETRQTDERHYDTEEERIDIERQDNNETHTNALSINESPVRVKSSATDQGEYHDPESYDYTQKNDVVSSRTKEREEQGEAELLRQQNGTRSDGEDLV